MILVGAGRTFYPQLLSCPFAIVRTVLHGPLGVGVQARFRVGYVFGFRIFQIQVAVD